MRRRGTSRDMRHWGLLNTRHWSGVEGGAGGGEGGRRAGKAAAKDRDVGTGADAQGAGVLLCFSQNSDLGASAFVANSLFHWLGGRFMVPKRMLGRDRLQPASATTRATARFAGYRMTTNFRG